MVAPRKAYCLLLRTLSHQLQLTATAVMVPLAGMTPAPFVTVQVCPTGCVPTVTTSELPKATGVENAKPVLLVTVCAFAPLFSSVTCSPGAKPVTDPETI